MIKKPKFKNLDGPCPCEEKCRNEGFKGWLYKLSKKKGYCQCFAGKFKSAGAKKKHYYGVFEEE